MAVVNINFGLELPSVVLSYPITFSLFSVCSLLMPKVATNLHPA